MSATNEETSGRTYNVTVDPEEDNKATEFKFGTFARPHMRAFYCAGWSYFVAYINRFAIVPLLPEVRGSLGISNRQIWISNIASTPLAALLSLAIGPVCDKYGPRIPMTMLLCLAAIPGACTGLVQTTTGLTIARLFASMGDASFVLSKAWADNMFCKKIVGTASSLVGGSFEAGANHLLIGAILFPLFRKLLNNDKDMAWRTLMIVPALLSFATGIFVYYCTDDCPQGNYSDLKRTGSKEEISSKDAIRSALRNRNTWILFLQNACIVGLEFSMNNASVLHFRDEFGQTTEKSSAVASVAGWVAPLGKIVGGYLSDRAYQKWSLKGRLWLHFGACAMTGGVLMVFANTRSLNGLIVLLAVTSLVGNIASSTSYSIVPYIYPLRTGSVAGIVATGDLIGEIGFSVGFMNLKYYSALSMMGVVILGTLNWLLNEGIVGCVNRCYAHTFDATSWNLTTTCRGVTFDHPHKNRRVFRIILYHFQESETRRRRQGHGSLDTKGRRQQVYSD